MAKIIELGFTDAQWELIQANYMVFDIEGVHTVECTEEAFARTIKGYIGRKVASILANKAAAANQNSFDV